jgi:hypothetical protein
MEEELKRRDKLKAQGKPSLQVSIGERLKVAAGK